MENNLLITIVDDGPFYPTSEKPAEAYAPLCYLYVKQSFCYLRSGDSMDKVNGDVKANGQPFTTKYRDNDNYGPNCAVQYKSAWWFNNCYYSDFNRAYSGTAGSSGTLCLSCNDLTKGELCTRVEMCKNDEVCFIQKYSANRNDYRYDVGCSYPELCRKDLTGHVLGRRSDHSHVVCHKCCNNSDTCNVRLSCDDDALLQKCLSCSGIADPRMCKNTTTCASDEICYLHKYTTYSKHHLYNLGCKHSALCTHGFSNILGRRSSTGVHQECESCCSGTALCNQDLQCDHHSQKAINSSCSTVNECIGNSICLSGICQCPSDEYYWNVDTCIEMPKNNDHKTSKFIICKIISHKRVKILHTILSAEKLVNLKDADVRACNTEMINRKEQDNLLNNAVYHAACLTNLANQKITMAPQVLLVGKLRKMTSKSQFSTRSSLLGGKAFQAACVCKDQGLDCTGLCFCHNLGSCKNVQAESADIADDTVEIT
ncbi:Hypothetical predicted protein [Mytilus galloprovincialis]|uniref:Fibrinogen C-terminal domain-containing protein n=1 Tax=Mytilus galloprovincialis TaxID=29158 RepID=A0A8B6E0M0_MYTGA|nr:Hypothetical predicted protein [Mytilus galloprovincialis]